jgi:hypothetical protein
MTGSVSPYCRILDQNRSLSAKKAESTAAGAPESNRVPLAQGVKLLTSSRLLAVVRGARALDVKVSGLRGWPHMYMPATARVALLAQLVRHEIPSRRQSADRVSRGSIAHRARSLLCLIGRGTAGRLTPCGPADVRSLRSARSLARTYGTLTFIQAHLGLPPSGTAARPPAAEATTTATATPGTCSALQDGGRG